ncbi:MAG TPA: TetR/AcrR family transcriptional regulator [Candidatus Krumholzibacteriaceae bacterium]|nr:TetR/AcrR family transcriptional regulator [Candidatus Krumholzibacteriaceae bacterium]
MKREDIKEKRLILRQERHRMNSGIIIKSAVKMFAKYGYAGTTVKVIAENAGVSVGMIYNYYRSKRDLFKNIMRYQLRQLELKSEKCSNKADPPLKRIRCTIRATFEHFDENRDFMLIYQNENPVNIDKEINEKIKKYREELSALLSEAVRIGDFVIDEKDNIGLVAAMIIGAVDHMIDEYVSRSQSISVDEMLELLDRIILRPLEGREPDPLRGGR